MTNCCEYVKATDQHDFYCNISLNVEREKIGTKNVWVVLSNSVTFPNLTKTVMNAHYTAKKNLAHIKNTKMVPFSICNNDKFSYYFPTHLNAEINERSTT